MNKKIIGVLLVLLIGLTIFGCTSTDTETNNNESSNLQMNTNAQNKVYQVGEQVKLGDLSYMVNSIETIELLGSDYIYKEPMGGGTFYLVELKIENISNSEKSVSISNDIMVVDTKGRNYEPDLSLGVYAKQTGFDVFSVIEKIPAGLSKTAYLVFEMPLETTGKIKIKQAFVGEALIEFK